MKAVVFDVGNVLYGWDIRALYAKLINDPARLDWFCRTVVTPEWHFQHDLGRPFAETSAELIDRFPAEADLIRAFGPRFTETITGEIHGMDAIIAGLAARGVPMFAITNFSAEFWTRFRPGARLIDPLRGVIVSGEERLAKPDPAIYALALRRFDLKPGEALFVDDRADNVAASEANGFHGHLFDGAAGLTARLSAAGLLA
ncbi:HAD family hydrolase [Sandarakinorhabdus rubra]|uniref:HAD family hydrolase n=1 Tax=Sandarakinorhabdus rubra TaxID=2672568 RepID=UPI001F43AD85|nr:HAD family phosphatase [Sandarakinorhabdus rubra]